VMALFIASDYAAVRTWYRSDATHRNLGSEPYTSIPPAPYC
jgi:hypothetical protein